MATDLAEVQQEELEQEEGAEQGEVIDGEVVDDQEEGDQDERDDAGDDDDGEQGDEDHAADDLVITIGDEPAEAENDKAAPSWVKDLRRENRDKAKRIRELEAQLASANPPDKLPDVGQKPTMEGCDYDTEKFEAEYAAWQERKRKAEDAADAKRRQQEEADRAWQEKRAGYDRQKQQLKVSDYEDAEEAVAAMFSTEQQGIIVSVADNPAHLVYALGKTPAAAKKLAEIKDPAKFIRELSRLEDTKLTVKTRNAPKPPAPERTVTGSAPKSGAVDNQLEQLRKEAERTGDYSKVLRYKREKRK